MGSASRQAFPACSFVDATDQAGFLRAAGLRVVVDFVAVADLLAVAGFLAVVLLAGAFLAAVSLFDADDDFAATSWDLRRFLCAPALGLKGIQRVHLLRDVLVLAGAGVGGGSLNYANTLYRPQADAFYRDPQLAHLADWREELASHYDVAERMLGVVTNPSTTPVDELYRAVAQDMGVGRARLAGYRQAVNGPDLIAYGDFSEAGGTSAMRALLDQEPQLDAVFAASDLMACGALRALREAGRRVPEDVAVVGFEDAPVARQTDPPLTTVHQPNEEMGRRMAEVLIGVIRGDYDEDSHVLLDTHLVRRASA